MPNADTKHSSKNSESVKCTANTSRLQKHTTRIHNPMNYNPPGNADNLTPQLQQAWNREIQTQFDALQSDPKLQSRFLKAESSEIPDGDDVSVAWFGDPAEPAFCFDEDVARKLSDWGLRGRHELHNEYCEYHVTYAVDAAGKMRPKRVEFTTELREYWTTLAVESPDYIRELVRSVLGILPSFQDLYGVNNPAALSPLQRKIAFSTKVAGNGLDKELEDAGVPMQPTGPLNTEHALFMTHPINGLDDLIYIVLFGAKPYAQFVASGRVPASKEQIFKTFKVTPLACRHADPRAATAAHAVAYTGKEMAFSNPLGVYIASFTTDDLRLNGGAVPASWTQFSRGRQRLVFGPQDSEQLFLDDLVVIEGGAQWQLTGGYDLARRVEVGPMLRVARQGAVAENEYVILTESNAGIACSEAGVCKSIAKMKEDYDAGNNIAVLGHRNIGPIA